ncbi:MAG: FtsX-like permease family protein [Planctomycetota bacterium]
MTVVPEKRIRRQVKLPLSRAFSIALKGIVVRFSRSLITASGVVLAIAFLMSAMTRDAFQRNCRRLVDAPASAGVSERWTRNARLFLQKQGVASAAQEPAAGEPSAGEARAEAARRSWIIAMSLAVCFLGIVNAQFMSVSERFREIGTMKCLGALDGFVVSIFVIESLLQGFLGSLCGALLGLALTLLQIRASFGPGSFEGFPAAEVFGWALVALAVGTSLSILAAVAPAARAARMQPADAMRVEE